MQHDSTELIETYLKEIIKVNERINLTRITDEEEARLLHLEDSLSVLEELEDAPEGLYGDLGSGGGFPGVPLSIALGRKTILIDSVKKKMNAVQEIIDRIGLGDQVSTYGGRIEELSIEKSGQFAVLTARALSTLDSLIELASPLLQQNGQLICLKAQVDVDEIEKAQDIESQTGMKLVKKREFYLSDEKTFRTVLVFEKVAEPEVSLPRRVGMAQKRPLRKK